MPPESAGNGPAAKPAVNPQVDATEYTARICRYCRRPYAAPKGSRPHACGRCAPTIMDAIASAPSADDGEPVTEHGQRLAPDWQATAPVEGLEPLPEPPHWTLSECQVKGCGAPAEVLAEGWPVCIDHADEWLERIEAIERYPAFRELLPSLGDR